MEKFLSVLTGIILAAVTIINCVFPSWYGVVAESFVIFLFIGAVPFIRCRASLYGFVLGYVMNIIAIFRLVHSFAEDMIMDRFLDVSTLEYWLIVVLLTMIILKVIAYVNTYIAGMIWDKQDTLAE